MLQGCLLHEFCHTQTMGMFTNAFVVTVAAIVVHFFFNQNPGENCLSEYEKLEGARIVTITNTDGSKRYLEYFRLGTQEPGARKIVLQHGSFREPSAFVLFDAFFKQQKLDVIAPTISGYGCSSQDPERKLNDWGATVAHMLTHAGWQDNDKFLVAGFSFGGPHALSIVAHLPERVSGVMVVSSTLPKEFESEASALAKARNQSSVRDASIGALPKLMKQLKDTLPLEGLNIMFGAARAIKGLNHLSKPMEKAMQKFRESGLYALADTLEAAAKRAHSRANAGSPAVLRLRDRPTGIDFKGWTLDEKAPILFISDKSDDIDPPYIADYLLSLVKPRHSKAEHIVNSSPFGHWHYWAHFEDHLRMFLARTGDLVGPERLPKEEQCLPSAMREFGPFYKPKSPYKKQICEKDDKMDELGHVAATSTFTREWKKGHFPLVITGRVIAGTDCTPQAGAEVDVWQSHSYGGYGSLNPGENNGFCRGVVKTGEDGRYEIHTYLPGSYGVWAGLGFWGPEVDQVPFVDRHIHMAVWAEGHEVLVTQTLWGDDPMLHSNVRNAAHGYGGVGVVIDPVQGEDGVHRADDVDLVLPRTQRPHLIHPSREQAVEKHCDRSTGDMLTPAICMPSMALPGGLIPPGWIFIGAVLMADTVVITLAITACCCLKRLCCSNSKKAAVA
eukprot:CAMPEP_0167788652 /NCGR_PEP_ID=MMETSP0111_2-20121227/10168_1 /TAXON_ID=91324 /ORGANISM="Lotharella globosa, Strain CCCM811" /LENGTH=671 /DNA_ID=CAMNT_0007680571 /DNA_START=129 /DNA_END=2144 /DNA_ORIENTATION=+